MRTVSGSDHQSDARSTKFSLAGVHGSAPGHRQRLLSGSRRRAAGHHAGQARLAEAGAEEGPADRSARGAGREPQSHAVGIPSAGGTFTETWIEQRTTDTAATRRPEAGAIGLAIAHGKERIPCLTDSRRLLITGPNIVGSAFALALLAGTDARAALLGVLAGLAHTDTAEGVGFRFLLLLPVTLLLGVDSERAECRAEKRAESTTGQGAAETAP